MTADFDPHSVPVRPAATVMLVADRPDLQVLMVRRTGRVVFAPDMWVFPGGRVDPTDHASDFDRMFSGLADAEASRILEVARGGLAWWLAACRETLEEAGLLLAASGPDRIDVEALRDAVRADESVFADLLLAAGIRLDASALEEVARFITPPGAPRRFDARFFVAESPADQEPHHDAGEIVAWDWVRPADALARWAAGEFEMMSPTVRMLACLARYPDADAVMQAARRRLPYRRVRVIDPHGAYRVVLPGETGYDSAELEVESGWVRLWEPQDPGGGNGDGAR
ncbi:MAG: NUDIX domain-containing protein [Gammaproteobacteria bacterium]|nr:NUDIX domain-containing protein [Gammaproteobacteria bacterium]MCP5202506.1 NUDIX domain-containing protein [Gammaproteobacteria bacterium]